MRRTTAAVVGGCAAMALTVGVAAPAWAHASFRTPQMDPGESLDAILMVPVEVPDAENTRVVVDIPSGFVLTGCDGPFGWTCDNTERRVTFDRVTGVADEDSFVIGLTAPTTSGPYSFRTEQTLDNGDREVYDGDPFSEKPAPVIVVRGESNSASGGSTPSTPQAQPTPGQVAPGGQSRPTSGAVAADTSSSSPTPAAGGSGDPLPSSPEPTVTESLVVPSADADADGTESADGTSDASLDATGGGSNEAPAGLLLLAGALLASAGAGVARLLFTRRAPTDPTTRLTGR